jgi:hypothetical protein
MADAVDAVQPWRPASLAALDADLAALWRDAARDGPLSRAVMSNLVIVRPADRPQAGPADATLADAVRRHPARTIVIDYAPDPHALCAPRAVQIGLFLFVNGPHRYGVERIAVNASCGHASLPSVVRRLIGGDLPTTLWWAADASRWPVPGALVEAGRQLLYDSAAWEDADAGIRSMAAIAASRFTPDLVDLNWRRLAPLRRALVSALGPPGGVEPEGVARMRVEHPPRQAAAARLVAGWLTDAAAGFAAPSQLVRRDESAALAVTIESKRARVRAVLAGSEVHVDFDGARTPLVIPAPGEPPGAALADELDTLTHDRGLSRALATVAAGAQP